MFKEEKVRMNFFSSFLNKVFFAECTNMNKKRNNFLIVVVTIIIIIRTMMIGECYTFLKLRNISIYYVFVLCS